MRHQSLGFGHHFLACIRQGGNVLVSRLKGAGQKRQVFDVFVHHWVAEFAYVEPGFGRLDQTQTFCSVKVV